MAILRNSAIALAAVFCLGVAAPVFAQQDKAAADVRAAQNTVKEIQALGKQIKARQAGEGGSASTPVASPVVSSAEKAPAKKGAAKKGATTIPAKKKKKNP